MESTMFLVCHLTQVILAINLFLCLRPPELLPGDEKPNPGDPQAISDVTLRISSTPWHVLALSPDGKLLATAEDELRLYDIASGRKLACLDWPKDSRCRRLTFSPDGRRIVTTHEGNLIGKPYFYVYLWEVSDEKKLRRVAELLARNREAGDYFTEVYHASFSPDSRTVVAGNADETIHLWDCGTTKERLRLHGGVAAAFAPDGQTVFAVSHDGLIRRFDAVSGKALPPPEDFVRSDYIFTEGVAFATNDSRVAVWDHYQVLVLDARSSRRICRLPFPAGCGTVVLSADARTLVITGHDGDLWFYDAATGKDLGCRKAERHGDGGLALSSDGRTCAWVENEKRVKLQSLQHLLGSCVKAPAVVPSDPPDVSLQAELITKQERFVVNLGKLTPEEFSNQMMRSISFESDLEAHNGTAKSEKEKEIEHRLKMPVNFSFKNTPLRQVVDDLHRWTGINIAVDKQALENANISMDHPVEMTVESVTLRSALANVLYPLRLTYVIEGEGIKITTEAHDQGRLPLKTDRADTHTIECPDYAFPSKPRVDLDFQVRNIGKQPITFYPDLDPSTFLAGPGALNISWPCQTMVCFGLGGIHVERITLKPGEKHSVRITNLKFVSGSQCLWIAPGEYSIYASCYMNINPAPKGTKANYDGSGWVTLRSQPLRVKVVQAEK
jgi:WD40 repeat protein